MAPESRRMTATALVNKNSSNNANHNNGDTFKDVPELFEDELEEVLTARSNYISSNITWWLVQIVLIWS